MIMQVKELRRKVKRTGVTVEFEVDNLLVRLIGTYGKEKTLEEMIYILACRRLEDKIVQVQVSA